MSSTESEILESAPWGHACGPGVFDLPWTHRDTVDGLPRPCVWGEVTDAVAGNRDGILTTLTVFTEWNWILVCTFWGLRAQGLTRKILTRLQ